MSYARKLPRVAVIALFVLGVTPLAISLCSMSGQTSDSTPKQSSKTSDKQKSDDSKKAKTKGATLAGFDGDRAYTYLVDQCKIGSRTSGTDGNRTLRKIMVEHFEKQGAQVRRQTFAATHPLTSAAVEMENIVASWNPDRTRRVLIAAHFDTRPRPDRETNPRKKNEVFVGANDGASGVAVLMELANMMSDLTTTVGVDLVAFDGEELVFDEQGDYFLGSIHFAQEYRKAAGAARYVAAIVVDMVGDRGLEIFPDQVSNRESPQLVQEVWAVAKRLRASGFRTGLGHDIRDDHLPLLDAGIPAIDLIDFDYGKNNSYWHTAGDTPDKCSAASLAQVGGVLAEWLRGK